MTKTLQNAVMFVTILKLSKTLLLQCAGVETSQDAALGGVGAQQSNQTHSHARKAEGIFTSKDSSAKGRLAWAPEPGSSSWGTLPRPPQLTRSAGPLVFVLKVQNQSIISSH